MNPDQQRPMMGGIRPPHAGMRPQMVPQQPVNVVGPGGKMLLKTNFEEDVNIELFFL